MNAKRHQDNTAVDSTAIDDTLSRTARQLHAAAVANVSASTQAQLHQRRRRALSGKTGATGHVATHRGMARPMAWGGAFAVLALAIALPMAMRPPPASTTARVADTAATTPATGTSSNNSDTSIATLEEDPEMYVWLASSDAIALASE